MDDVKTEGEGVYVCGGSGRTREFACYQHDGSDRRTKHAQH